MRVPKPLLALTALLCACACVCAGQTLQPAVGPDAKLPVINGSVPMVVPPDAAVSTTIITTVTDDGKPTETTVQTVPGLSLPSQYTPHVVQYPPANESGNANQTFPANGVFASDIALANAAKNSAAIAFKAASNALQSAVLSRQTAEAAAAAARSAAMAAQAAIAQATHGYLPKDLQGANNPLVLNPSGAFPLGPQFDPALVNGVAAGSAPSEPNNGTQTGSKGPISPFFQMTGPLTNWPGVSAGVNPQLLPVTAGDDKVAATVISCKYSVETKSLHFGQFQCQRKMDNSKAFCDVLPEDPAGALPRLHTIRNKCRSRAGVMMFPQCKHVFVRNPFHRNKLLHRVQCWSACACHVTIPRWNQCRRQAKYCLGGFTLEEFPNKQTPLFQHCTQRYNGCVSDCNVPYRSCLSANALASNAKLRKCIRLHKRCTNKWAGSPSRPSAPEDPQNTDNPFERFLPAVEPSSPAPAAPAPTA